MKTFLDHVQVAMPDGQESQARAFYGALLGLAELQKPEALASRGGVWFALSDDSQLHLGVEKSFIPARKAHPAFRVTKLFDLAAKLQASGYSLQWDDQIPGVR